MAVQRGRGGGRKAVINQGGRLSECVDDDDEDDADDDRRRW